MAGPSNPAFCIWTPEFQSSMAAPPRLWSQRPFSAMFDPIIRVLKSRPGAAAKGALTVPDNTAWSSRDGQLGRSDDSGTAIFTELGSGDTFGARTI
jgi:hypothetical protein